MNAIKSTIVSNLGLLNFGWVRPLRSMGRRSEGGKNIRAGNEFP